MIDITPTLRPAVEADLDDIISILASHDLPTDDLAGKASSLFVLESYGDIIGTGGVEVYGDAGLLRSVAVQEFFRDLGLGGLICSEIFQMMKDRGVKELFLLTTTAPEFFEGLGFQRIERDTAPADIKATTEFSTLCPESAVCMRLEL